MGSLSILITGATAGIGRHTALALAKKGHRVFATGRREAALATLHDEAKGLKLETLVLDVTSPASIEAARQEIARRTEGYGVDVLVNNAGYGLVGPLETISDHDLRAQFDTNVFGLMAVTRAFVPAMRARGKGRIVNVSSVGGRITFPLMGAYTASKFALESLSDALRMELAPFGLQVSLIEPGPIRTEFSDRALETVEKYRATDSPYAAVLSKAAAIQAQVDKSSVGPEIVVKTIVRVITARRPNARYVTPYYMHFAVILFRLLPTRLMDAIFRSFYGLTPRVLGTGQHAASSATT